MHKCEIFDCLDSRNFYITKPNREGDLGTGVFLRLGPIGAILSSQRTLLVRSKKVVLDCFEDHSNVSKLG